MNTLALRSVAIGLLLCLPLTASDFSVEPAGAPPTEGVGEAIRAAVEAVGVRVKGADGKVVSEFWPRKTAFEGEPAAGFGIRFDTIPEGAFLGLVRFPEGGSDFREQSIPAGVYTLRYGLHPEDGNHMGVAPSRDFALLVPVAVDPDPVKNHGVKQIVEMSAKTGNPHPTIARVELPEGDQAPHLWRNDYDHWVLDLKVDGEIVGIVVHGQSEE